MALLSLALLPARGVLTVIIHPGYTFSSDENPTTDTLNQLGEPTAEISGTVDGSTGLTAGSVSGTLLSDDVPDGVTLDYNGSVPRQIEIMAQGVFTNNLNTNDWLWPLAQDTLASRVQLHFDPIVFRADTNDPNGLALNYDPHYFTTNSAAMITTNADSSTRTNAAGLTLHFPTNTLALCQTNGVTTNAFLMPYFALSQQTNIVNGATNAGPTLTPNTFTSAELTFTDGAGVVEDIPHGLKTTPVYVSWVFVCKTNDNGYHVGDEVNINGSVNNSSSKPNFVYGANSTNVFLVRYVNNATHLYNKIGGSEFSPGVEWKLKCYARP